MSKELPARYTIGLNLPSNSGNVNDEDWSSITIPDKIGHIEVSSWEEFFDFILKRNPDD